MDIGRKSSEIQESFHFKSSLWVRMVIRRYKDISTVINPNKIFESLPLHAQVSNGTVQSMTQIPFESETVSTQIGNSISTSRDNSLEENLRL